MIGILDSGSGGLTVLRALREEMPSADVLYFADLKNAPYGERSREELSTLTTEAIATLVSRGATSIVSACNSVSASLSLSLVDTLALPPGNLIEMVGPTVSLFRGSTERVIIVATPATVRSEIYQHAFRMIGMEVTAVPVPGLARAIEYDTDEVETLIKDVSEEIVQSGCTTAILACTHYPLALEIFRKHVPPEVTIIDPAYAVAARAKKQLWPREVGDGTLRFLLSKDSTLFRDRVRYFFKEGEVSFEVVQ